MSNKKTILVAPLNWGLGHASRCIPIVQELLNQNTNVILAGSGKSLELISSEFPKLKTIELPDYDLRFNHVIPLGFHVALQSVKMRRKINLEKLALEEYLASNQINGIISDNRYGIYSKLTPSVMLTHQLKLAPKTPFRGLANRQLKSYLNRFSELWVPDTSDSKFSGLLSSSTEFKQKKHIGILSRFKETTSIKRKEFVLAIISGTEPHRTLFENRLIKTFRNSKEQIVLVRGLPKTADKKVFPKNFTVYNHLATADLEQKLVTCKLLISRSGYSTIMDAARTSTPVILVPTKGQSEQEYLAKRLNLESDLHLTTEKKISENDLHLAKTLRMPNENLLSSVIGKWLNQL